MSTTELHEIRDRLIPYLDKLFQERSTKLDMLFFMLTDIINESSEMLCYGKEAGALVEEAFHRSVTDKVTRLPGVVSRKKQLVPSFMEAINRMNTV